MKRYVISFFFLAAALAGAGQAKGQVNWTPLSPAIRCCMGMAANVSNGPTPAGTLLFGGFDGTTYLADTWVLQEGRWVPLIPSISPSPRQGPGMAYDAATNTVVLFGGTDASGNDLDDTWIWNGITWTQAFPSAAPPGRRFDTQAMAYDAAKQTVLLFGGYSNVSRLVFGDTWTWNGKTKTWAQQLPTVSPSPRRATLAYDSAREKVVLFGGDDPSAGLAFGDTWIWDGTKWTQRVPAVSPSPRGLASMAFNASLHKVVLYGGVTPGLVCPNSDTWAWNGTTWTYVPPPQVRPGRFAAGMAADPEVQGVVVFAGFSCGFGLNDTWVLAPTE